MISVIRLLMGIDHLDHAGLQGTIVLRGEEVEQRTEPTVVYALLHQQSLLVGGTGSPQGKLVGSQTD